MWHIKQAFVGWLKSLFRLDAIETEHIVFTDPGNYAHKMHSAVTFMRLNSALLRCCLGTFKDQTWKQSRNPHVESHLLCWAVSWCSTSSTVRRGWAGVQEAPLPLAAEGRQLVLCLAGCLGASRGGGLCWSPIQGRGCYGGEELRLWLPEQGKLMCKAPARIAAPCLGQCSRHSAQDPWLKTTGPSKSCQPGRAQHCSLQGFSWAGCVSCWVDGGWPDQEGQFLGRRERRKEINLLFNSE